MSDTIHMGDCYKLGCSDKLEKAFKEHKKKYGKDHVCSRHCTAWLYRLHKVNHAWYNEQEGK